MYLSVIWTTIFPTQLPDPNRIRVAHMHTMIRVRGEPESIFLNIGLILILSKTQSRSNIKKYVPAGIVANTHSICD